MRWMLVMAFWAMAAWPALAEPNEAEKLFRDMEKKVAGATSLECTFESTADFPEAKKLVTKASIILAEGDKTCFELSIDDDGKKGMSTYVSDGAKTRLKMDGKVEDSKATPKNLALSMRAMISRTGPFAGHGEKQDLGDKEYKVDDACPVTDFKLGKKEKIGEREAQEIQYTLKAESDLFTVHVWLDTQTNLPLKRIVTYRLLMTYITFTDTNFKFDPTAKVDAKKFDLPKP